MRGQIADRARLHVLAEPVAGGRAALHVAAAAPGAGPDTVGFVLDHESVPPPRPRALRAAAPWP
jgi:hypothetical protein